MKIKGLSNQQAKRVKRIAFMSISAIFLWKKTLIEALIVLIATQWIMRVEDIYDKGPDSQ
jgi:hypothetical protein